MWILPEVDGVDAVSSIWWTFLCAFDCLGVAVVYWMQVAGVVDMPSICRPSRAFDRLGILKKELLRKCSMGQTQEFNHKYHLVKSWLNDDYVM